MPTAPTHAIPLAVARRLAVARQRLAGPPAPATPAGIHDLVRDLGCLQLDPISVVARSHLLVLFSRLGPYDPAALDCLLWEERRLFEYWAHCASIVLTEDYPIHHHMMRRYDNDDAGFRARLRAWVEENAGLRDGILARLRAEGPLLSRELQEEGAVSQEWLSTGWTSGRNVSRMLDYLWLKGEIMVASRVGGQKRWDLAARCLPDWTPRAPLPERESVRQAAERSLRALGVARPRHIQAHFIRGRYPGLSAALAELAAEGRIVPVSLAGADGRALPGPWYLHADDLPLVDALANGHWQPRTTLLSPFDNLICDRARTTLLFDFDFRIEIYTPKEKRRYGYYVLPILHGDRLIGRIDPTYERRAGRLTINAVHAEPDAPDDDATAAAVAGAVSDLARFLDARAIALPADLPPAWAPALRGLG